MPDTIRGLHHVTSISSDASATDVFFKRTLGLRRIKKTVNFDAPDVYHLYYGDALGTPGTVMTYFPFPNASRGRRGVGEVATTLFSVPEGTLDTWQTRLDDNGVGGLLRDTVFGENRLCFEGPDGDAFALVETIGDGREPWTGSGIDDTMAIRGFHSVALGLRDPGPTAEVLTLMGYAQADREGDAIRYAVSNGNGAGHIDLVARPDAPPAGQGAGSVHHIAFAVADRAEQLEMRDRLADAGMAVTPVIDRDYFWAIYFRSPGGVLFEVATAEPGFTRDEDRAALGAALKLPDRHEHLRERLEASLPPIPD